eukprot:CAMPEP_0202688688 /NCGR_PEP_ID=MMETSP1385-20130828/4163_1 /ASSEMBLY_ACC=CAM_ASM_000861 /TAXON_ID=933848 /ORGANISM="Elphidium margaritaceum" /LENGTH=233 /DNA_ID=CAMNT_0049343715 /DNA_START=124 /DNA_END=825 /DNA_ORIENTATION=+
MDPNAKIFVPSPASIVVDASSQRASHIRFLHSTIEQTKARLSAGSSELMALHKNLKKMVCQLQYQYECRNNGDPNGWSDQQIDAISSNFQRLCDEYNVKNSVSHDLASQLVSMQQKLRAVLLKPVTLPPPKRDISLNLAGGRLGKLDAIDLMNRPHTPRSISASTLPPIMEEDAPIVKEHESDGQLQQATNATETESPKKKVPYPICQRGQKNIIFFTPLVRSSKQNQDGIEK